VDLLPHPSFSPPSFPSGTALRARCIEPLLLLLQLLLLLLLLLLLGLLLLLLGLIRGVDVEREEGRKLQACRV
jgi:hypothetical protein